MSTITPRRSATKARNPNHSSCLCDVMDAMLQMDKLDLKRLQDAYGAA